MAEPTRTHDDANRRNARNSTGPKTPEGKGRSRRNALKHGLAAEVLVPDELGPDLAAALARWEHEAGPDNVVEEHLVRRAAVASVTLARLDGAREATRSATALEAARDWEERKRHAVRRRAQRLEADPVGTVAELEATAFGCDWLIRQWEQLDGPLRLGRPWGRDSLDRAQLLLGLPTGAPGPDAEPEPRLFWLLAAAMAPDAAPPIPRIGPEADLPTDPIAARAALRAAIADRIERLLALRAASWEATEGPELRALAARASAADTSRDGQLRHRYGRDADRSHNAAMRLYLDLRDRRRRQLLAIAKEAASQQGIPRAPVGDGWWREVDSAPAPPGFTRIPPHSDPTAPTDAPPEDPGPPNSPPPPDDPGPPPPAGPSAPPTLATPTPPAAAPHHPTAPPRAQRPPESAHPRPRPDPLAPPSGHPAAPPSPRPNEPSSPRDPDSDNRRISNLDQEFRNESPDRFPPSARRTAGVPTTPTARSSARPAPDAVAAGVAPPAPPDPRDPSRPNEPSSPGATSANPSRISFPPNSLGFASPSLAPDETRRTAAVSAPMRPGTPPPDRPGPPAGPPPRPSRPRRPPRPPGADPAGGPAPSRPG